MNLTTEIRELLKNSPPIPISVVAALILTKEENLSLDMLGLYSQKLTSITCNLHLAKEIAKVNIEELDKPTSDFLYTYIKTLNDHLVELGVKRPWGIRIPKILFASSEKEIQDFLKMSKQDILGLAELINSSIKKSSGGFSKFTSTKKEIKKEISKETTISAVITQEIIDNFLPEERIAVAIKRALGINNIKSYAEFLILGDSVVFHIPKNLIDVEINTPTTITFDKEVFRKSVESTLNIISPKPVEEKTSIADCTWEVLLPTPEPGECAQELLKYKVAERLGWTGFLSYDTMSNRLIIGGAIIDLPINVAQWYIDFNRGNQPTPTSFSITRKEIIHQMIRSLLKELPCQ